MLEMTVDGCVYVLYDVSDLLDDRFCICHNCDAHGHACIALGNECTKEGNEHKVWKLKENVT